MAKTFNIAADCKPDEHYMVSLDKRLEETKALVDAGRYFTINRARQYGKTTTLRALNRYLQTEYYVVSMDFQTFGSGEFENENRFSLSFGRSFLRLLKRNNQSISEQLKNQLECFSVILREEQDNFRLQRLFETLSGICAASDRWIVLMIDEVDSAANNQVN